MRRKLLGLGLLLLILSVRTSAQIEPLFRFADLMRITEENPSMIQEAKEATGELNIPYAIYLPSGIYMEARAVKDKKVLFAVIKNIADIYDNAEVLTWEQIESRFSLVNGRMHFMKQPTINPNLGYPSTISTESTGGKYLLVPEWNADKVIKLNPFNGDLIDANFIVASGPLQSPKQSRLSPHGFISVSDQISDLVQKFDTSGNYLGFFAPAGGVNTAILDNIRGHNYRANNNLVVTVGGGGNNNSIPQFDASGNFINQFITAGSGGLNSPFDIVFRTNDCLVSASSSNKVHRYTLDGTYINDIVASIQFPQQIHLMSDSNFAVAGFSTPSALYVYNSNGTQIASYNVVTGLRGAYRLPNGNYLVTNGSGIHEITTSNTLVRTIVSGASAQYIDFVDFQLIPVELTSFMAQTIDNSVLLRWSTATELNNYGFEIQRTSDRTFSNWNPIAFINGKGTTSEPQSYSFRDENLSSGKYYYRLKQIDFDGSFEYSHIVEAEILNPNEFILYQNYPNPFNPTTKIKFATPVDAKVKLSVYNPTGEKISELTNKFYSAGTYEVSYNANELNSGIYFYKIEFITNNGQYYSDVKKFILVK
ncbi:MAG: T9SS type A sorting domain-containing protein [Ignavibacterium sp.]|nr:T9SS type A sorting domain-containing protein [Ignavibacterium sp.]